MTDNELLLAISCMMDKKLQPINEQLEEHTKKFEVIDKRFDAVDKRFDAMDERLEAMDGRLQAMDSQLKSVDKRLKKVELRQENEVLPRLQNIEACYTSTFDRYRNGIGKLEAIQEDVAVIKSVVSEHSEKLKKIS